MLVSITSKKLFFNIYLEITNSYLKKNIQAGKRVITKNMGGASKWSYH